MCVYVCERMCVAGEGENNEEKEKGWSSSFDGNSMKDKTQIYRHIQNGSMLGGGGGRGRKALFAATLT